MSNPTYIMLTVANDHVEAHYGDNLHSYDAKGHYTGDRTVLTTETYASFFEERAKAVGVTPDDLTVMCSSTMDFPEDETKNAVTIALCRSIRG